MTFQFSVAVRDAQNEAVETTIGATAVMKIFSGAEPANCAAADPAGLLATLTLPADWLGASASGVKSKAGVWAGTGSSAGTAASWRIYNSAGAVCGMQGNTTDAVFDNTSIGVGQAITVNTFAITRGNA